MDPLCLGGGVGGGGGGGTHLFGNHEAIIRLSFNRNICTCCVWGGKGVGHSPVWQP